MRRILANAIARRLAYVLVAAALSWLGLSDAKAQACTTNPSGCTRQQAYDACMVYLPSILVNANYTGRCHTTAVPTATAGTYSAQRSFNGGTFNAIGPGFRWDAGCGVGQEWNDKAFKCQSSCTNRGPQVASYASMIPSGSVTCSNGCEAMVSPNGDGTYTVRTLASAGSPSAATHCSVLPNDCAALGPGYTLNYGTSMCQAPAVECAENQSKDPLTGVCTQGCVAGMVKDANGVCKPKQEDCPAGNVRAPSGQCLPGDGQCAAGEARRENGTCGKDSDGDGEADEDDDDTENDPDKESASGGDSCNAPPSCSGGAIACMQVKIQWRIDCNTRRKVNVSGGACSAMPVCTGENCDAMQYASLLQQWKASCNLEKLLAKDGGEGEGGQPEWTKVNGMSQDPGAGETAEDLPQLRELAIDVNDLDQSGFGGGSGCAGFVSSGGSGLGASFTNALSSPPAFFCNYIALIRGAIILIGAISAVTILLRGGR